MAEKYGTEFITDGTRSGGTTDAPMHAGVLGDDGQGTWNLNDPRQFAAMQARQAARKAARQARSGEKGRT